MNANGYLSKNIDLFFKFNSYEDVILQKNIFLGVIILGIVLAIVSLIIILVLAIEKKPKIYLVSAIVAFLLTSLMSITGLFLIFFLHINTSGEPTLFHSCLTAPNSQGCTVCKQGFDSNLCDQCEDIYAEVADGERRLDEISEECS